MSLRAAALAGGGTGGGVAPFPGYISGNWYPPYLMGPSTGGTAGANAALTLTMEYLPARLTLSGLGCRILTLSAGGNAMVGLYAHNAVTGRPTGAALASVTGLSTSAVAEVTANLGANVVLESGFYWTASQMDNATAVFGITTLAGFSVNSVVGSSTAFNVGGGINTGIALSTANTYGSFPDLTAASFAEGGASFAALVVKRSA